MLVCILIVYKFGTNMSSRISRRSAALAASAAPWILPLPIRADAARPRALPAPAQARLNALQANPDFAGERVYQADVYPLGSSDAAPLYVYARHVHNTEMGMTASHLTYLPSGELMIEEKTTTSRDYRFQRLDIANRQTGLAGSVELDESHNRLVFEQPGLSRTRDERVTVPVVAGPNLHGHIITHWEALMAQEVLPVRMAVLSRMETLGFTIRKLSANREVTSFQISPSSILLRLVVAPLQVTFDNATRRVTRYAGRVPPMQVVDQTLKDLDATVNYHWHAPGYR